jgi:hypothetical protein
MKVAITLKSGKTCALLGVDDADGWVRSFTVRGTSLLGDWVEVEPEEGEGSTFVRASEVVIVRLIDEEAEDLAAGEPRSDSTSH